MSWTTWLPELIRPHALWLWLALPLLWWWGRQRNASGGWASVIDAHLLAAQLDEGGGSPRRQYLRPLLPLLAWWLAVLALAGPSWGSAMVTLERRQSPLVVAVELSDTMTDSDLAPSRLLRLRDKLGQLLAQRRDGALALVVYAGDAYTVVPLTGDVANVALFVDALSPSVMPQPGRDLGRALDWSAALLREAGQSQGQVLVLATHADAQAVSTAERLRTAGVQVSVIGVGPATGWDMGALAQVGARGGGGMALITHDVDDLQRVGVLATQGTGHVGSERSQRQRRDDGPWLLPVVLLLLLPALRRGAGLWVVLLGLPMLMPAPVQAAEGSWWQRADQQAHARITQGVTAYHRGDFTAAEAAFRGQDSADGFYNLGNALARQGRLEEAVSAYDQALARSPGMDDAEANRRAVLAALRRKRPPPGQNGSGGTQGQKGAQSPQASPETPGQGGASRGDGQQGRDSQDAPQDASGAPSAPSGDAGQKRPAPSAGDPGRSGQGATDAPPAPAAAPPTSPSRPGSVPGTAGASPEQQRQEAWLQRVPDDPGALLRQKLLMEQARRQGRSE